VRPVKWTVPMVAALLLAVSGCGVDRPKPPAATEEIRHPSNEMNPLPKEEPKQPPKRAAVKRGAAKTAQGPIYEDPRRIPPGIQYGEMVRRFGLPTMRVTDSPSRTTYSYSKLKMQVQVEVQNGKVVSVAAVNTGF